MRSMLLALTVLFLTACGDDPGTLPDLGTDHVCAPLGSCTTTSDCATGGHCVDIIGAGRRCVTASNSCGLSRGCPAVALCRDSQTLQMPYGNPMGLCSVEYIECRAGCVDEPERRRRRERALSLTVVIFV